jgi:hypothetical protein
MDTNNLGRFDLFGKPVPQFRLHGQEKVGTVVGSFLSLTMVSMVLLYSTFRCIMLVTGARPIISSYTL